MVAFAVALVTCPGLGLVLIPPSVVNPAPLAYHTAALRAGFLDVESTNAMDNIFPTTVTLARTSSGTTSFDFGSLLDDVESTPTTDTEKKAEAKRLADAEEAKMMAARDEIAIKRMAGVDAARQREFEAQKASGAAFCEERDPSKVLGDSGRTGVLSAKACMRVRDGQIESGPRTGALLIF